MLSMDKIFLIIILFFWDNVMVNICDMYDFVGIFCTPLLYVEILYIYYLMVNDFF